jgi:serine phosphatase RsbU (regulator of sigma subunit)
MPVAFYDRMDKFTTRKFTFEEGDMLYMYTDGYPDQFGGERGKKFKYIPFKRMILENAGLPMEEQNQLFARTLDEWMGPLEQIDDICVLGVKF